MAKATKKDATEKASPKKTTTKKVVAKKETLKKETVAKVAAKEVVAKKATVKKATVKKTTAKNAVTAKKVAAKKPAAKRAIEGEATGVEVVGKKPARNPGAELTHEQATQAAEFALEKKAVAVRVLDLREITSMTDYFVIASGDSDKQVKAIAENVIVQMRDEKGVMPWRSEGWDTLQWVIVDFVDFVVHVFQSEARTYYNLERLWADAPTEQIEDKPLLPAKRASRAKKTTVEETETAASTRESVIRVIHHS